MMPKFDRLDDDYRTWSIYCEAYLQDRGVWHTVVGPRPVVHPPPDVAEPPEGTDPAGTSAAHAATARALLAHEKEVKELAAWERKEEIALSNINMTVKPHLVRMLADCKTAAEAWGCLKDLFVDDTTSRRADLEDELSTLKLQPGEAIIQYVGRSKGLRNELAVAGVKKDEESLVLHVLRGLPPTYGVIRTFLKSSNAPLRMATTTAKLLSVEKELAASDETDLPPAVQSYLAKLSTRTDEHKALKDPKGPKEKDKKGCHYCKRPGHRIEECRKRMAADEGRKGGGSGKGDKSNTRKGDEKIAYSARVKRGGRPGGKTDARANVWVVDSGATHHLATGHGHFKVTDGNRNDEVTLAAGHTVNANASGVATVMGEGPTSGPTITLRNTLRVPDLDDNLMSVPKVDRAGGAVLFANSHCYLFNEAAVIAVPGLVAKASVQGPLTPEDQYLVGGDSGRKASMMARAAVKGTATVWHRRYFHLGYSNLERAAKMVDGMPVGEVTPERVAGAVCRPCAEGKMARAPFPTSDTKTELMELVHVDITGPFTPSIGGSRYLFTLYEDDSKVLVGVPIKAKSDAGKVLRTTIPDLERRSGRKLKKIRFDNAKEFITATMRTWYDDRGIEVQTTLPYSPQSNGKAERANRTIKDRVRAALSEAEAEEDLWAEAAVAAIYVINRSPKAGMDKTPWEALTGKRPDVSGLVVWGSRAFALKPPTHQRGMAPRTAQGRMVGYAAGGRGYRVLLKNGREVVERRDVVFDETGTDAAQKQVHWGGNDLADREWGHIPHGSTRSSAKSTPALTPSASGGKSTGGPMAPVTPDVQAAIDAARLLTGELASDEETTTEEDEVVQRYPGQERRAPSRYGDEAGAAMANTAAVPTASTKTKKVMVKDLPPPPKTVEEAKGRRDWNLWKSALEAEQQSMRDHEVWRKQKAPPGKPKLKTRVLFEYKTHQSGELERAKCRIVGRGDRQRPGRDYRESWAEMPAAATTRCLLATAAARGWHVHHLDIRTAYLYAPMDMEVYIVIPDGFEDAGEDALLLKAMYGTKQAGRLWGSFLHETLTKEGAVQSTGDRCVYTFHVNEEPIHVEVHVDDLLVCGSDINAVNHVKAAVAEHFKVRDLGEVKSYLGMEVKWNRTARSVSLANPRHTLDLLREYNMEGCKSNEAPMARGAELGDGKPLPDGNLFAELVGSLLYLGNQTRPDISFAVGRLARRMATPTEGDWRAAKAVLRYLQGTKAMGLVYCGDSSLCGWVDSDYGGDKETRKSTTGFVFTLNGAAVS